MREEDRQLSDQGQVVDKQQGQGFTLLITPALSGPAPFSPRDPGLTSHGEKKPLSSNRTNGQDG